MLKKEKIIYIIVICLVLVSIVFGITKEQAEISRTCTTDGITQIFDKYSDSEQTGYILTPKGDVLQFVCKDGKWIPTLEYAEINKLDIDKIELSSEITASSQDEKGRDIIYSTASEIIVDKSKEIVIGEKVYNVTYIPIIKETKICIIMGKAVKIEDCFQ
jgi:hypothetical protein